MAEKENKPLLCRLGIHDWGVETYHEEEGSFVEHSVKVCKRCGKKKEKTRKFEWDKS
ncbi:hypothetical protein GF352_05050 [archaeon]|nr:hypothetical protein [archaeon]